MSFLRISVICLKNIFEELCDFYNVKKERISEDNTKRADWKLVFDNFVFLIEQKSSIYSLNLKQQTPDIDRFEQDIKNKLLKGIKQLDTTADELNLKSSIKILLYYDDFFDPNILTEALNDADCKISDDNFFIANIIEMEMLLELSSCDKKLFEGVVEEMIKIKKSEHTKNLSLLKIMIDIGWRKHSYMRNSKFFKYEQLLENTKRNFKMNKLKNERRNSKLLSY